MKKFCLTKLKKVYQLSELIINYELLLNLTVNVPSE